MSPMLTTEMPRVSPACARSPPRSPLVIPTLPAQAPCVISLSPYAFFFSFFSHLNTVPDTQVVLVSVCLPASLSHWDNCFVGR